VIKPGEMSPQTASARAGQITSKKNDQKNTTQNRESRLRQGADLKNTSFLPITIYQSGDSCFRGSRLSHFSRLKNLVGLLHALRLVSQVFHDLSVFVLFVAK
jgi:hypothetical protein